MVKLRHRILLSPFTKYIVLLLITGTVLSTSVYILIFFILNNIDDDWSATCDIKPNYQVECLPGRISDYESCTMVGCCWSDETNNCYHSLPPRHSYYGDTDDSLNVHQGVHLRPRREYSPMGSKSMTSLYFYVTPVDSEYLQMNLRIGKAQKKSPDNVTMSRVYPEFSVSINSSVFSVTILRHRSNSTKIHLLSTTLGPLIVTKSYWEWTIYITNITLYGLESTYINGTTHWLYNNAKHSKIPAFFGITSEGEAFAWYVAYSGPMEIRVIGDSNLIVLKGMSLPEDISLHVFASSTPAQTIKRLFKSLEDDGIIIKTNSNVSWASIAASLGLHVCPELKYIKGSIGESINVTLENAEKYKVPWDTHCIHRQFYSTLDTILNRTEMELVIEKQKIFHNAGRHLVPHLTPMILANNNILLSKLGNSSLILKKSLQTYVGSWQGKSVAYPEWSDNRIYDEFPNYVGNYTETFGSSKLIIVRDAWPRDDTNTDPYDFTQFDYMPQELERLILKGTIPYELTSMAVTSHYTAHNSYADKFHAFVQQNAYPLLSKEVLFHNVDDENADMNGWSTLREIINRGIGSSLVGQLPPIIYVCSTSPNMSDELCIRWYGAAVVFPYVMTIPEYFPGGTWITIGSSKYASELLKLRARLITYQCTVMEEYSNSGQPVLAPIHFYYPLEPFINGANNIDQFFWGPSLLVGLVTLPNTRQLRMQIPGNNPWRHLADGAAVSPSNTKMISIPATLGEIVILVRPGHLIPVHENVSMTSAETVGSGVELFVNLAYYNENDCFAQGKIGYGSGIFLNIIVNETVVTFNNILKVRSRACMTSVHQSTLMQYLTILGDKSRNRLSLGNLDICRTNGDTDRDELNIVFGEL